MRRSNFTLVTMSQLLKVAVVGHLGKWHADKYAAATDCELVAVVGSDAENARDIAPKNGAEAFSDYRDIIPLVDAASPVLPTSLHYKIAGKFLEAGIHCLIKKPTTDDRNPIFHQYTLLGDDRDSVGEHITAQRIACAVYYPFPLHQQKAFSDTPQADLPITETTASRCLSFPIFPEMTEALCAAMLGTR
jgi:hypothetical protein